MRLCLVALATAFSTLIVPSLVQPLHAENLNVRRDFFRSGGQARTLLLDMTMDVVAVNPNARSAFADQANQTRDLYLRKHDAKALHSMNLGLIANHANRSHSQEGMLVWFDEKQEAIGIMTADLVVGLNAGSHPDFLNNLAGVITVEPAGYHPDVFLLKVETPMRALELSQELVDDQDVEFAHPDFTIPKDFRSEPVKEPFFAKQWHLSNTGQTGGVKGEDINILPAWKLTRGHASVKIAIIDGGFDIEHEDLKDAWDVNLKEIPNNGKDDDQNGYKDDVIGWNLITKSSKVTSGANHGTAVAGLVAARANGKGVVGGCPECKIIPIVAGNRSSADAAAFYYAKSRGARIITNSWGYRITPTDAVAKAIRDVALNTHNGKGTLILFAMNNIDKDDCKANDLDISAIEEVFAVSGIDHKGLKVPHSAWGPCMEVVSPTQFSIGQGNGITTTDVRGNGGYNGGGWFGGGGNLSNKDYTNDFGGTSAATPITAGVFGLILSLAPDLDRQTAFDVVIQSAKKVQPARAQYNSNGFSNKYGYGRVDASAAIQLTLDYLSKTGTNPGPGFISP